MGRTCGRLTDGWSQLSISVPTRASGITSWESVKTNFYYFVFSAGHLSKFMMCPTGVSKSWPGLCVLCNGLPFLWSSLLQKPLPEFSSEVVSGGKKNAGLSACADNRGMRKKENHHPKIPTPASGRHFELLSFALRIFSTDTQMILKYNAFSIKSFISSFPWVQRMERSTLNL